MKPIIFSIDDDPQVLRAIRRDLRGKYGKEFRIISTESANEALKSLVELQKKGEAVALFISDQRMPEMLGVEFLEKAKEIYPEAKRILLTAYSDTDAAIKAINDVQLDYYLMKPWDPPEEKLFPVIDDQLDEWAATHKPEFHGIRVVGYQFSPKSHKVKDFLSGNLTPYQWMDIEKSGKAKQMIGLNSISLKDLPATFFEDGSYVLGDNLSAISEKMGRKTTTSAELYDVVIIGSGPAGLAAGVYGGSEGLKTLIIEKRAPGGQAGTSSRIENYLGFPKGLSGADLTRRAVTQASRFGVEFLSPKEVVKIETLEQYKTVHMSDGTTVNAKSIVISTGVDYRRLEAAGADDFSGAGVYYGAATTEAGSCRDQVVYVIGGGNSAGQGAMYLSQFAKKVNIVIRREDLSATMSSYLIDQINGTPNIEVMGKRQVVELGGNGRLDRVCIQNLETNETETSSAGAVFVFIGAKPFTEWLGNGLLKDDKGFIMTGRDLLQKDEFEKVWKQDRDPYLLETCVPGIFAAGDVRSGAMNRVASATGEGAMAISFVHKYLAEI
ncbi:MAG: FAD-dependent oxidoreductase [Bacteroidetes bacterium]|nr:FAD-dependent oxidoreductase [Bacteroidota bacterium]